MKWDRWTTAGDRMLLLSKFLVCFAGRRIDLHKIVGADEPGAFHNHPANAVRIILRGSYEEETPDGSRKRWRAGMVGYVPGPRLHRLSAVNAPCYTLWVRGRDRFLLRTLNRTGAFAAQTKRGAFPLTPPSPHRR